MTALKAFGLFDWPWWAVTLPMWPAIVIGVCWLITVAFLLCYEKWQA